jgi:small subunit ribosomal protein S16
VVLAQDRIKHWISVGAQPTERVSKFLEKAKLVKATVRRVITKQSSTQKDSVSADDNNDSAKKKEAKNTETK